MDCKPLMPPFTTFWLISLKVYQSIYVVFSMERLELCPLNNVVILCHCKPPYLAQIVQIQWKPLCDTTCIKRYMHASSNFHFSIMQQSSLSVITGFGDNTSKKKVQLVLWISLWVQYLISISSLYQCKLSSHTEMLFTPQYSSP